MKPQYRHAKEGRYWVVRQLRIEMAGPRRKEIWPPVGWFNLEDLAKDFIGSHVGDIQ